MWILIFNTVFLSSVIWYVHRQSTTDNLTKLKNRRALYQKYSRGIPANKTVVYLDVNKFKHINDTYGHQVGDEVLKQLSQRILTHWRAHSFRLGGDEFVLIGMVTEAELQTLLEPILAFDFLSESGEHFVQVNASLGFSMPRAINLPIDEVLHLADVEMYKNKQNQA
ncbi:GGDEF domain-containing protein [Vibrio sp. S11_S32]|uniref:GGDEF domain-containing protein n=1 Tax=Vibrio sp. S11_S32 TaxID=2720225 RepID=UPI001680C787|nr:GGDEF domain-containing protein [Vibrio sp. S11_S32]MBD1577498.1 GGDEF domain-containing protein [Vibrio sp. S11_S32]